jgi:hypothetical protein
MMTIMPPSTMTSTDIERPCYDLWTMVVDYDFLAAEVSNSNNKGNDDRKRRIHPHYPNHHPPLVSTMNDARPNGLPNTPPSLHYANHLARIKIEFGETLIQ